MTGESSTPPENELLGALFDDPNEEFEERRRFPRQAISVPVDFVPLYPTGPRFDSAISGETRNVSPDGVAVVLPQPPLTPRWGVLLNLGSRKVLLEVSVRYIQRTTDNKFFLSCQFVRRFDDTSFTGR